MTQKDAVREFAASEYNSGYRNGYSAGYQSAVRAILDSAIQSFVAEDDAAAKLLRTLAGRIKDRQQLRGYEHDEERHAKASAILFDGAPAEGES